MRSLYVAKQGLIGLAGMTLLTVAPAASAFASGPTAPSAAAAAAMTAMKATDGLRQVGTSPFRPVTAVLPDAVSVTFDQALSRTDAQMTIIGSAGVDIGTGSVATGADALRRSLAVGSPGGPYTVFWHVVSASGTELSGSFQFTAARGNGKAPAAHPTDGPAPPTTAVLVPSAVGLSRVGLGTRVNGVGETVTAAGEGTGVVATGVVGPAVGAVGVAGGLGVALGTSTAVVGGAGPSVG
jgi:methionine-rich copper-binding protein CopC